NGNSREIQFGQPVWSADGSKAVSFAFSADNKDRWVLALDVAAAKARVLANDHDKAWVSGPTNTTSILGWMKNDREVYFLSERTGYSHLYAVSFDGGEPRALTSGNWEVTNLRQSRDKSHFYLTASKENPYEQHLYELPAASAATPSSMWTIAAPPDTAATGARPFMNTWAARTSTTSSTPPGILRRPTVSTPGRSARMAAVTGDS